MKSRARPVAIDRASGDDVMSLVSDRHDPPMQVGAVLLIEVGDHLDVARLTDVLERRLASVPRLRQNLVHLPVGCGRPVWVDYPAFTVTEHVAIVRWPEALSLAVTAWINLFRRPAHLVRGSKVVWAAIIGVTLVGPVAYFRLGRLSRTDEPVARRP